MLARTTPMPLALRDVLALTKPRLSGLVLFSCGGAMVLAPGAGALHPLRALISIVATAAIIGAANALNCYIERDRDEHMERTRERPLPAGRLDPRVALVLAAGLLSIALPALTIAANPLTAALGLFALVSYVAIYTPMKPRSPLALWAGAVPGAIPPVMGWTAVRGAIELPAVVLFAILFCWQVPHFLAISVFRKDDYARAGHRVLPLVASERTVKFHAILWTFLLGVSSLLLVPAGIAGLSYGIVATILGGGLLAISLRSINAPAGDVRWARALFGGSLTYLTVLFFALGILSR